MLVLLESPSQAALCARPPSAQLVLTYPPLKVGKMWPSLFPLRSQSRHPAEVGVRPVCPAHMLSPVLMLLAKTGPMLLPCRVANKSPLFWASISRVIKGFQAVLSIPENLKVSSRP